MGKEFLETGKIVGTHGVRGELRVECWCDSPQVLTEFSTFYYDEGRERVDVESARPHKGMVLLKLKGVDTVEQGDALRGKVLWLKREDYPLKPGQVFLQDLMGLSVIDGNTGKLYGVLTEIIPTGANDVYRIRNGEGKEFLFPAVEHMIQEIDVDGGKMLVLPIPGIFDEEGEEA